MNIVAQQGTCKLKTRIKDSRIPVLNTKMSHCLSRFSVAGRYFKTICQDLLAHRFINVSLSNWKKKWYDALEKPFGYMCHKL